jgi:hypothetical protein
MTELSYGSLLLGAFKTRRAAMRASDDFAEDYLAFLGLGVEHAPDRSEMH